MGRFFFVLFLLLISYVAAVPLTDLISLDLSLTVWSNIATYFFWLFSLVIWFGIAGVVIFVFAAICAFIRDV